jgi:putative transposase
VIDEFTQKSSLIHLARKHRAIDVLNCLAELFLIHGAEDNIRSDNGLEFVAEIIRGYQQRLAVQTLFIEP